MKRQLLAALLLLTLCASVAAAQTNAKPDASKPARATLTDFGWLVGEWTGTGFGGISEETWSPPRGGAMMGMFRQMKGNDVSFYEFLTLVEREGTVALRLKHFNADLTGWEEKAQVLEFPLLEISTTKAVFNAMTFTLEAPDKLTLRLRLREKETVREELFEFVRVRR